MKKKRGNNKNIWISIGAAVLIILLIAWLGFAALGGNTDVAA